MPNTPCSDPPSTREVCGLRPRARTRCWLWKNGRNQRNYIYIYKLILNKLLYLYKKILQYIMQSIHISMYSTLVNTPFHIVQVLRFNLFVRKNAGDVRDLLCLNRSHLRHCGATVVGCKCVVTSRVLYCLHKWIITCGSCSCLNVIYYTTNPQNKWIDRWRRFYVLVYIRT